MKNVKRPEKQHTVGAILLGTLVASVITFVKMPDVIDSIVSKVYGPAINIKPDDWEVEESAPDESPVTEEEEEAVIPEEE